MAVHREGQIARSKLRKRARAEHAHAEIQERQFRRWESPTMDWSALERTSAGALERNRRRLS